MNVRSTAVAAARVSPRMVVLALIGVLSILALFIPEDASARGGRGGGGFRGGGGGMARSSISRGGGGRSMSSGSRSSGSRTHGGGSVSDHMSTGSRTGAGVGASHQTGWTSLVAKLLQQSGIRDQGSGIRDQGSGIRD